MAMEETIAAEFDNGISNLIQNAVLHACMALSPVGIKLPGSGTHRIEKFCADILSSLQSSENQETTKKKKKSTLPEQSLLPEVEILNFYEGASTYKGFAAVVCDRLAKHYTKTDADTNPVLKQLCWEIYSEYQKADITFPKWLVDDSTYNLWLIFCSISSPLSEVADIEAVQDTLVRVFQLSGYSWNEGSSESIVPTYPIKFPQMLECLTKCFTSLDLHPNVVTEMIVDLKDELVCGVLKKGYLRKKGHKARNIKRRWFVLTRNDLVYYESRDKMKLKGQIILNPLTTTEVLPDKPDKNYRFQLTCGKTNVKYELYADDNKSRHEWMLDIGKAIQLENAFQQKNENDFIQSLSHFYRLRYGTLSTSVIPRTDSLLKRMKWSCSPGTQQRINRAAIHNRQGFTKSMVETSPLVFDVNKIGARTYTFGTGPVNRQPLTSISSDEEDSSSLTDNKEVNDDHQYVRMYPNVKNTKLPSPTEDVIDEEDNTALSPYEVMNISPQRSIIADGKTKVSSPVKGKTDEDLYLVLKSEDMKPPANDDQHYLTLTELGADDEEEQGQHSDPTTKGYPDPTKKGHPDPTTKGYPDPTKKGHPDSTMKGHPDSTMKGHPDSTMKGHPDPTTSTFSTSNPNSPIAPPRPVETMSDINSSIVSPNRSISLSDIPVPPPRPIETMTGRSYTQPITSVDESMNKDGSPNNRQNNIKSEESSSLRHPPYSDDQEETSGEHELYYIVPPNFKTMS